MKLNYEWVHGLTRLRRESMILWMDQWGAHLVALYVGKWNCHIPHWPVWKAGSLLGHHSWKIE